MRDISYDCNGLGGWVELFYPNDIGGKLMYLITFA